MRIFRSTLGAAALGMLAGIAVAETGVSGSESSSSTFGSTTSTHESSSVAWSGGSGDTALSAQQCVTEVMSRASTANVNVLSSRPIKDGVWVRVGVGPDQTPWHCVAREDGATTNVGPVRQSGHHGQHHDRAHGHAPGQGAHGAGGGDPFFDAPGIYEQACLMDVENKAGTLNAVVLGSEQTEKGLRVHIGVGPDRTRWHCLVQDSGTTSDIGPDTHHGGHHHGH